MFTLDKLKFILAAEPSYRLIQAKHLIFRELITDWAAATVFPLALRQKLQTEFPLSIKVEPFPSCDGRTIKAVFNLHDGERVEAVLMDYPGRRNTVCVSSMAGCPLRCAFCATGQIGFRRNLEAGEIIDQVLSFARFLKQKEESVNNLVFMGMGEPFLNYDNVLEAVKILNSKDTLNIGARHFSISTAGLPESIRQLAKEKLAINLAVSLHAPDDETRRTLMPIAKQYSLGQIFSAVDYYLKETNRKVMFEYLLIKDVNDSDAAAKKLAKLMKKKLYLINLLTYNLTGFFEPTSPERLRKFHDILKRGGVDVTLRHSFGDDIAAACGQLAGQKMLN
ncbi:MAG TPA: 23S rRNA (adenine(2503)-C(2))-methyltransferase RlmN [bacterium]|nr:23S rRNA (adenine(2503)-C(2))-methyltransferase RlmN [bacterium]